jgi:hypothetical protein
MENQQKPPTRGQPRTLEVHNKEMMNNTISTQQRNDKRQQKRIIRRLMKSKSTNLLTLTKKTCTKINIKLQDLRT